MQVKFTVEGAPVGYDRSAARLMFTPREVSQWRDKVKTAYRAAVVGLPAVFGGEYRGPIAMTIDAYGTRADVDNTAKEVMDGLKGAAFVDDRQVVSLTIAVPTREFGKAGGVKKPLDARPRADVTVEFIDYRAAKSA